MKTSIPCKIYKLFAGLSFAFSYLIWYIIFSGYDNAMHVPNAMIFILTWVGIAICIIYAAAWKRLTGKYYTTFNIFLAFLALFNFGQCFLWAFGIHTDDEIGKKLLFSSVAADDRLIVKAQLMFIISYIAVNTGALFVWSSKNTKKIETLPERGTHGDKRYRTLYMTSLIIAFFSIPCALYQAGIRLIYSQLYSYHDLYYGSIASTLNNPVIIIGSQMFFASLLGLLIGSCYKDSIRRGVYIIFGIYAVVTLLCGDRGEWLQPFIFLLWAHWSLYKPINSKKLIKWIIIGIIGLYIIDAIVGMRNTGLSFDGFYESLTDVNSNPIISNLIEFGQSMGIVMIVMENNVVPIYGNTYLMTIPTLFGTGFANGIFGLNYVQLHTWFPAEYLEISYGTDFSIIGEAVLNFGTYFAPCIILIEGLIIGRVYSIPNRKNEHPLGLCLSISCMASILKIARSTVWLTANEIVCTVLAFSLIYLIVSSVISRRRK